MEVCNILEKIVWDNIDVVLKRNPEVCCCDKCRADIAAYALNKLSPRYVVTDKGAVIARALSLEAGFQIELLIVLTEAVKLINANPRHQ
jgi:competence protein ComFB